MFTTGRHKDKPYEGCTNLYDVNAVAVGIILSADLAERIKRLLNNEAMPKAADKAKFELGQLVKHKLPVRITTGGPIMIRDGLIVDRFYNLDAKRFEYGLTVQVNGQLTSITCLEHELDILTPT